MRIFDYKKSTSEGRTRVSAKVAWEDFPRAGQEIYFETTQRFSSDLNITPDAFLLAAVIPAMWQGERRVQVEGTVCPLLRNGLATAMQLLVRWYGPAPAGFVSIEPTLGFVPSQPKSFSRRASFMSGGVDSLATLRVNRSNFGSGHASSIKDCFFVHGFDIGGYRQHDANLGSYESALARLYDLEPDAGIDLVPVYTNIRHLEDENAGPTDNTIFSCLSHGAALASVAHAFSNRITSALVPGTDHVDDLSPWGSHPLLDPHYNSAVLQIRHDGIHLTRLEKVRLISEWEAALGVLRTCLKPLRPAQEPNCGRCEKCVRTMVQLVVAGKLSRCPTYPLDDISADYLNENLQSPPAAPSASPYSVLAPERACYWRELPGPLREVGREDLARVVESKLRQIDRHELGTERKNFLRQFDRKCFGGKLTHLKRRLRR